jgi:anthranilate synthase component 1
MIAREMIIFDHRLRRIRIISNAFIEKETEIDQAYRAAKQNLEKALKRLHQPITLSPIPAAPVAKLHTPESNTTRQEFEAGVAQAKELIAAGDIFQVVLSQRFEAPYPGKALELYRCLRFGNPSPYMFLLNFGEDFAAIGSSPELHVRVRTGLAEIRPIAGTRPRGKDTAEDDRLSQELLADPKDCAEHVMLIDLGRNDLGRVSEFGTVRVTEQMVIERYSHVMHIVSHVAARLRAGRTAFDAMRATFPAGTVSGAPKIRAMQIIRETEKSRRGFYSGIVGYFGFDGSLDSCIALRSIVLKNGRAYFQTGAGIVADSVPAREYEETVNKAKAMLDAIARTEGMAK